uniref:Uncharacterized protein n=1 Tax=Arundo donax TaxID=35708 RepID=A0A0A9G8G8_ARUDO
MKYGQQFNLMNKETCF